MDSPQERRIRDWMTVDPVTVASSTTLPKAYWLMVENRIRRLLVVDGGKLVGIVTMEDLRGSFHTDIIAINPLKVNQILSEMLEHKISTLPVVESGKVVGIITESSLFRVLVDICLSQEAQEDEKIETETAKGHK